MDVNLIQNLRKSGLNTETFGVQRKLTKKLWELVFSWNSQKAKTPSIFPKVPWAMPVAGKKANIKGEWFWEYSSNKLNQIDDAEEIRDHVLRAIYGNFANAKKSPKNALVELKWVAYVGGRRESQPNNG